MRSLTLYYGILISARSVRSSNMSACDVFVWMSTRWGTNGAANRIKNIPRASRQILVRQTANHRRYALALMCLQMTGKGFSIQAIWGSPTSGPIHKSDYHLYYVNRLCVFINPIESYPFDEKFHDKLTRRGVLEKVNDSHEFLKRNPSDMTTCFLVPAFAIGKRIVGVSLTPSIPLPTPSGMS